jgi:hypothetical protein
VGSHRTADAGYGQVLRGGGGGSSVVRYAPTYGVGQICTSLNQSTPVNAYLNVLQGSFSLGGSDQVTFDVTGEGRLTRSPGPNTAPLGIGGISARFFVFPNNVAFEPDLQSFRNQYMVFDRWVMSSVIESSLITTFPNPGQVHNALITPITVNRLLTGLMAETNYNFVLQVNWSHRNTAMTFDTSAINIAGNEARGALFCHPQAILTRHNAP